jgi:hypothetical protein
MILLALMLSAPACVSLGPHRFACEKVEQCLGIIRFAPGENQCVTGVPLFKPKRAYIPTCSSSAHLHPRGMDTSQPDVKGAPRPVADGKCHSDKSDEVQR